MFLDFLPYSQKTGENKNNDLVVLLTTANSNAPKISFSCVYVWNNPTTKKKISDYRYILSIVLHVLQECNTTIANFRLIHRIDPLHCCIQVMTAIALQRRLQNVGITLSTVEPGVVSPLLTCIHISACTWFPLCILYIQQIENGTLPHRY